MRHNISEKTKGVFIIAATPFQDNGDIDFDSIDRLVEFYIEKGVSGITILGMMGEAQKLNPDESTAVMERVLSRVDNRVPVIVGVSNPGMGNLVTLSHNAMNLGAAGVMVAPFAAQKTETALYNYYESVCLALGPDVPLCYQDFPLATGVNISVDCFLRMVRDFEQLVMLKHEDWPGLPKLSQIRKKEQDDGSRRVSILCGNGGLYLPQELARGADGAMTGFAYPEMLVQVCSLFHSGDVDAAEDLFDLYLPVVRHEQQPGYGLAVRKEILRRRGAISTALTRAPGPKLSKEDHVDLDRLLARLESRLN
ncbi:dihydrodipicolinate synthase family protein [Kiloniella litopenaei]|uniref:dihydrodipicolinate synthase family protein n=1 Tax=Kiloniella litopenaei TaxID=1549748 RepID=UPI003BAC605D